MERQRQLGKTELWIANVRELYERKKTEDEKERERRAKAKLLNLKDSKDSKSSNQNVKSSDDEDEEGGATYPQADDLIADYDKEKKTLQKYQAVKRRLQEKATYLPRPQKATTDAVGLASLQNSDSNAV